MSTFKGFSQVQLQKPLRSTFDLTHDKRLSCKMGYLVPIMALEALPSDTFKGGTELLARVAPMLAPIYDQMNVFVHYYFVPYRILWPDPEGWETFITGGRLGVGIDPVNAPIVPQVNIGIQLAGTPNIFQKGTLADYLGVPVLPMVGNVAADYDDLTIDLLPFAAYYSIWYEYYRDRNFVDDNEILPLYAEIKDTATDLLTLRKRSYSHDYFNSSLPFTQRGTEVLMPLAGSGSVTYLNQSLVKQDNGANFAVDNYIGGIAAASGLYGTNKATGVTITGARIENIDEVQLDSSQVSINDFRSAYALQVWLERNAIGGSRYTESTQAHFGVRPQDSRLQRPEYIGGGRIPIKISEVVSTAWSSDGAGEIPLANLAGHGVTYGNTNNFNYFCTEHGIILGILSIMNPASYHQGLPRMFRRRSFLDYPWPTFAKLGEQQVDKVEIFASAENLTPDPDTGLLPLWGYQSRYADWKYIPNTNHGDFHDTLLHWTLTRDFTESPVLWEEFNEFDTETQERIFAVNGDAENFWIYAHNAITVKRPLPYFGTPNTLGFQ